MILYSNYLRCIAVCIEMELHVKCNLFYNVRFISMLLQYAFEFNYLTVCSMVLVVIKYKKKPGLYTIL